MKVNSTAQISGLPRGLALSYLESKLIPEVSWRLLWRLIGQESAVLTLSVLLTGSRGEYLRVVGILGMVE